MNVYDNANALANELRQCDEVREYARLKEVAEADETNRRLLAEFRKMQMKMQLQAASGGQASSVPLFLLFPHESLRWIRRET